MEAIKKNMFSIVCGGVVVLSIAATWDLSTWAKALAQKMTDENQSLYTQIYGEETKTFNLPIVDPTKTEAPRLADAQDNPIFPTEKVKELGLQLVDTLHKEAEKLSNTALKYNGHEPLVPG